MTIKKVVTPIVLGAVTALVLLAPVIFVMWELVSAATDSSITVVMH